MHLYVAARGQYRWLWDWVANLSARYLPFDDKSGIKKAVQLSVRPWQIFEIVFPEPSLKQVLGWVQPYDGGNTKPSKEGGGLTITGRVYKQVLGMSRLAGLMKVPRVKPANDYGTVNPRSFVGVTGIGLKNDIYHHETGMEML